MDGFRTVTTSGSAYYTPPSEDLTRPGRTWWPTGGRQRFATWKALTIVFHEAVPGHHLEIGATRVAGERLSRFARFSEVPGHGEGWLAARDEARRQPGFDLKRWHTAALELGPIGLDGLAQALRGGC